MFSIANIDIKYPHQAKKYAISVSSNGFLILFNMVGINQKISTSISNITDKNGLSVKTQRIIEINQNNNEKESPLDIFLLHLLKEINAMKKQRSATNHILNAHNQALSYIWIVKIIKDIRPHINQETICGLDSHLITLLK